MKSAEKKTKVRLIEELAEVQRRVNELEKAEEELRSLETRLAEIGQRISDVIFEADKDGCFTYISPGIEKITGYTPQELIGKPLTALFLEADLDKLISNLNRVAKGESIEKWEFEIPIREKLSAFVEINLSPLVSGRKVIGTHGIARDITERKLAEKELQKYREHLEELVEERTENLKKSTQKLQQEIIQRRQAEEQTSHLNKVLQLIRRINQLIVKIDDESELLQEACHRLIASNDYKLAWIGYVQEGSYDMLPVAQAGFEDGYLSSVKITCDDTEYGQAPSGTAIRTGEPCIARDFITNPQYHLWREEALGRGYKAAAAFPLRVRNEVIGVLVIYSEYPDDFDKDGVGLLVEMASDISLGIEKIRHREELQRSEARYRTTLGNMLEGCQIIDYSWRYIYLNDTAVKHSRMSRGELVGRTMIEVYPGIESTEMFANLRRCMEERVPIRMENRFSYPDGSESWFELNMEPVPEGVFILSLDTTKRKRAEEHIQNLNEVLRALRGVNQLITREKDRERLIQQSCELMVGTRGVYCVWVLLFDEQRKYVSAAAANAEGMQAFLQQLEQDNHPPCIDRILASEESLAVCSDIVEEGKDCLSRSLYGTGTGLISRLEYEDKVYGVMSVYVPSDYALDPEEQSLFRELAGDIAYALSSMEKEEIREQAERVYRALFESSADGILIADIETKQFKYANPAICRILGYSEQELKKMTVTDIHPEDFLEYVLAEFEAQAKGEKSLAAGLPCLRKDGAIIYADVSTTSTLIDGKTCNIGFFTDVTERKRAEEALIESETRYRRLFEAAKDGILIINAETGLTVDVNPFLTNWVGFSKEEIIGKELWEIEVFKDIAANKTNFEELLKEEHIRYEDLPLRTADGRQVDVEFVSNVYEVGHQKVIQCNIRDITWRKQAEEALAESEQKYRSFFETSRDCVFITSREGRWIDCNQAAVELFGYESRDELMKVGIPDLYENPDDRKRHTQLIEQQGFIKDFEVNLRKKDGNIINVLITSAVKRDEEGNVLGYQGIIKDITERRQAEERLQRAQAQYQDLYDEAPVAYYSVGMDGRIERANKAGVKLLGYSLEELQRMKFPELYADESKSKAESLFQDRFKQGLDIVDEEMVYRRKDGEKVYGLLSVSPARDKNGQVTSSRSVIKDITERKQMEEQLIVTDRLASIGELASGIAHEINNPLTGIIGLSEIVLDADVPPEVKEDMKTINSEAQRTARIVHNLLTFARKQPLEKQPTNINDAIAKVLELRAYEQKVSNINVITHLAPDLPEIIGNSFQLQQVFLNIIINAEYFMTEVHGKGNLTISTERADDMVQISIVDDGPGITKETLRHIFDPFFTTKEVGKGTGLGLSLCHGIVTEHGGRIYAESEVGKGVTFIIVLPIAPAESGEQENGKN
jgi:two-component system, NtrC family, sensor kinase